MTFWQLAIFTGEGAEKKQHANVAKSCDQDHEALLLIQNVVFCKQPKRRVFSLSELSGKCNLPGKVGETLGGGRGAVAGAAAPTPPAAARWNLVALLWR